MVINSPHWEERRRKHALKQSRRQFDELSDAISQAYQNFNSVSDPDLMDACIFEINALRSKRDAVLRDIRKLE